MLLYCYAHDSRQAWCTLVSFMRAGRGPQSLLLIMTWTPAHEAAPSETTKPTSPGSGLKRLSSSSERFLTYSILANSTL